MQGWCQLGLRAGLTLGYNLPGARVFETIGILQVSGKLPGMHIHRSLNCSSNHHSMKLNNRSELEPQRKALRNFSTSAEVALWLMLKGRQLDGRKFRRQHSFGPYVLDFYCPGESLAIELDGEPHLTQDGKEHDERRAGFLEDHGIKILRFENFHVLDHPEAVIQEIKAPFKRLC